MAVWYAGVRLVFVIFHGQGAPIRIVTKTAQNNTRCTCVISGCCREEDENCDLLGYYAASNCNFVPKFRDNLYIHLQGSQLPQLAA